MAKYKFKGYTITNCGYHQPDHCVWWEAVDENGEACFHGNTLREVEFMILEHEWEQKVRRKDEEIEKLKSMSVGNAAAMREALYEIHNRVNSLDEECGVDPIEVRDIARAALAKPPRNCDGFGGDFKMLHKAWFDWTGSPSGQNADGTVKLTFAEWLLAHQPEDDAACRSHLLQAKMDAEKPINPEAKPLRVCDVNTLESLSDFIVKTVLSSDHLKAAPDCYRRLVEASIIIALKVAYEPANINNKENI